MASYFTFVATSDVKASNSDAGALPTGRLRS
jgi:hypothetical protein